MTPFFPIVARTVLAASTLALQALAATRSTDPANGADMTPDETDPGEVEMQPRRAARRLWVLTAALLVASTALGLWSAWRGWRPTTTGTR